ncbi:metallophosphoesterase family protein [Runella zeae]|uniref:metallophosphoesterase family protein n=1 Tax=Runella zeae TaxID=94255 RepID=UPI000408C9E3|nr:metallophosphoesterase family protein [Runella zeae]
MKRTLVIGDIHGGLRALHQVLTRADVSTDDTLIFLGDYVDGWSESAQVISFLIDLEKSHRCIFIKGNHDLWCEGWLDAGIAPHTWLMHGGSSTAKSYQDIPIDTRLVHLNFFNRMKFYHIDAQNRLFVHAGYTSVYGPEEEQYPDNLAWDRTLWETAMVIDSGLNPDLFPRRLKMFNEIFIGHTPTIRYGFETPMHRYNVWNIDTGAAFYGKLTLLDVDTHQYWQSDTVQNLYPDEKGRNH